MYRIETISKEAFELIKNDWHIGDIYGHDYAEYIIEACNNYERLLSENKQWETNYNNLSAEFEEVSAIAQSQEKDIAYLKEQLRVEQARNLLHILNKGGE
jgi:hypothetical protein